MAGVLLLGHLNGPDLFTMQDRHDRPFAIGPTHEEVITDLLRGEINSYKKLPMILYQIQNKFRNEKCLRSGLLRGREFIMKDAYLFHSDQDSLNDTYEKMYQAYKNIFTRIGLEFRAVEADSGAIGGKGTHEFMALADAGEDTVVICESCDYSANDVCRAGRGRKHYRCCFRGRNGKSGTLRKSAPLKRLHRLQCAGFKACQKPCLFGGRGCARFGAGRS